MALVHETLPAGLSAHRHLSLPGFAATAYNTADDASVLWVHITLTDVASAAIRLLVLQGCMEREDTYNMVLSLADDAAMPAMYYTRPQRKACTT